MKFLDGCRAILMEGEEGGREREGGREGVRERGREGGKAGGREDWRNGWREGRSKSEKGREGRVDEGRERSDVSTMSLTFSQGGYPTANAPNRCTCCKIRSLCFVSLITTERLI